MYPFERFLYTLKQKAQNKAWVEASICEAYIAEETAMFRSHYFETKYNFYGITQANVELEYRGVPMKRVVSFKCVWFDPMLNRGTKVHPHYRTAEVHASQRYNKYDQFILAQQAMQVYYMSYPCFRQKKNWLSVIKIKAHSIIDTPVSKVIVEPFQMDELEVILLVIVLEDEITLPILHTPAS
ncbi:hypothetical protein K1719_000056 [Acacia pycnantha]|nr:hypothetical protein K1719_000056 [Acacia pycnantha]